MSLSSMFYNPGEETPSILWQCMGVLLSLSVITTLLLFMDDRTLNGVSVWAKPLKFELSLIIHLVTLSTLSSLLSAEYRTSRGWKFLCYSTVAAILFEILYITLQASRGRDSHFNQSTDIESLMYGLMGLGALILVFGSAYLGWCLYQRYRQDKRLVLSLSAALGLIVGSLLTLVVAGHIGSGTSHFAGELTEGLFTVPLLGWVIGAGDLRVSHFFATHAMQLLPLFGLGIVKLNPSLSTQQKSMWLMTGVYILFVVSLFLIALY